MRGGYLFALSGRALGVLTAAVVALTIGAASAAADRWEPSAALSHDSAHPAGESLSGYGGSGSLTPLASGLNQPKKLSIAPDGSVIVAESGDGAGTEHCTTGEEAACFDETGAIARISSSGKVTTLLGKLPSVSSNGEATGPAQARFEHGALEVLFQDTNIDPLTGESPFGPARPSSATWSASRSAEARRSRRGSVPSRLRTTPTKARARASNSARRPRSTAIRTGSCPTTAAGRSPTRPATTCCGSRRGASIHVLAVFPTISEIAAPGTLGPGQTTPVPVQAQPVPDSVAIGPDGALYVGELGGFPFNTGSSSVYRVVPGHAPTVVASGFTAISDVKFDPTGRLLVLEIDQAGLLDPAAEEGLPTPGALIGVHRNGTKSTLLSTGLEFPTGLAVDPARAHLRVELRGAAGDRRSRRPQRRGRPRDAAELVVVAPLVSTG